MVLLTKNAGYGKTYFVVVCNSYIHCGMTAEAFYSQQVCAKREFSYKAVYNSTAFGASVGNMCLSICYHNYFSSMIAAQREFFVSSPQTSATSSSANARATPIPLAVVIFPSVTTLLSTISAPFSSFSNPG